MSVCLCVHVLEASVGLQYVVGSSTPVVDNNEKDLDKRFQDGLAFFVKRLQERVEENY